MWRRFAMPRCNPWALHLRVGLQGETYNAVHGGQGRLACTALRLGSEARANRKRKA